MRVSTKKTYHKYLVSGPLPTCPGNKAPPTVPSAPPGRAGDAEVTRQAQDWAPLRHKMSTETADSLAGGCGDPLILQSQSQASNVSPFLLPPSSPAHKCLVI